jgi:hypothetical protein
MGKRNEVGELTAKKYNLKKPEVIAPKESKSK